MIARWLRKRRACKEAESARKEAEMSLRMNKYRDALEAMSVDSSDATVVLSTKDMEKIALVARASYRILRGCYDTGICPKDIKDCAQLVSMDDVDTVGGVSAYTLSELFCEAYETWFNGPYGPSFW